ncbi:MAG: hypothetical protein ACLTDX_06240 [[Clostridium] innocuum]
MKQARHGKQMTAYEDALFDAYAPTGVRASDICSAAGHRKRKCT